MHSTERVGRNQQTEAQELQRIFARSIVLMRPDRLVFPPSWIEHIPFAFWLMDALRPRIFVELGTQSGNCYAALAQAAQHLGLNTAGYAIDTWRGDEHTGAYDESLYTEWRSYHDTRYSSFSRLMRSTFDEAVVHFADCSVDLVHVDGCHTYEAVTHDVATWLPKMSSRGVMLLHDINVRERTFGAWRAWDTLKDEYPSFEFLHGHGLGVLAVGAAVPEDLKWLVGLRELAVSSPEPFRIVRDTFAELGATVLARHKLNVAEQTLAESNEQLSTLDATARALAASLEDARGRITILNQHITDAEHQRRSFQEEERTREAELRGLEEENAKLRQGLAGATAAHARQQSLAQASAATAAAASATILALRTRTRALASLAAGAPIGRADRVSRIVSTLRALRVTPSQSASGRRLLRDLGRLVFHPSRLRAAHLIAQSGLFDARYYLEHAVDVRTTGQSPLVHFVTSGGAEGRRPHPLFDSAWYLERHPDVKAGAINPLAHYLRVGHAEDRQPHALFSGAYYRAQFPAGALQGAPPLQHYVRHGALEGRRPHPLFDSEYYTERYGHVVGGADPLEHFLEQGAAAGFDPHPLFDTHYCRGQIRSANGVDNPLLYYLGGASPRLKPHPLFDPDFYRRSYRDVAASGIEALTHFVVVGGAEGRRPSMFFDSAWYLQTYEDVARSGANPLEHYLRYGWRESRNPSPEFDTNGYVGRYADVAAAGVNPLIHYVETGRAQGRETGPAGHASPAIPERRQMWFSTSNLESVTRVSRAIVCLSHVVPYPPRAGNEYRIHRLLRWLRDSGYVVIPIIAPNDGRRLASEDVRALAQEYGNAVFCPSDGRLQYVLRDIPDVLRSLDGEAPNDWTAVLREDRVVSTREHEFLTIDRSFCTDALIATVLRLQSVLGPYVLLAEYVWMSRILPLVGHRALRVIDTHDVFSNKGEKVAAFGINDFTISREGETLRLNRADMLIAIQDNERHDLVRLAPLVPVVTAGVDFAVTDDRSWPAARRVLYVASSNPINARGLRDFLRFAWPRIRERFPDAELIVAGKVAETLVLPPAGVTIAGLVEDLGPLYRDCRVVINPAVAGTGLKIKTLEALSQLRPVVTWPNGVDGLSADLARMCLVASDWPRFASHVVEALSASHLAWFSAEDRERLANEGSAHHVYAELGRALQDYFSTVGVAVGNRLHA